MSFGKDRQIVVQTAGWLDGGMEWRQYHQQPPCWLILEYHMNPIVWHITFKTMFERGQKAIHVFGGDGGCGGDGGWGGSIVATNSCCCCCCYTGKTTFCIEMATCGVYQLEKNDQCLTSGTVPCNGTPSDIYGNRNDRWKSNIGKII